MPLTEEQSLSRRGIGPLHELNTKSVLQLKSVMGVLPLFLSLLKLSANTILEWSSLQLNNSESVILYLSDLLLVSGTTAFHLSSNSRLVF